MNGAMDVSCGNGTAHFTVMPMRLARVLIFLGYAPHQQVLEGTEATATHDHEVHA